MNKETIIAAIVQDIRTVKAQLPGDLAPGDHLVEDIGLESLDMVELIARIEARFRIPIDDNQYRALSSIDKIADYILEQQQVAQP